MPGSGKEFKPRTHEIGYCTSQVLTTLKYYAELQRGTLGKDRNRHTYLTLLLSHTA